MIILLIIFLLRSGIIRFVLCVIGFLPHTVLQDHRVNAEHEKTSCENACGIDQNVEDRAVASSHDFQRTPDKDEILSRLRKMDLLGSDILKIAVMPQSRADVITLLDATQEADAMIAKPIVTMSMGSQGLISRLCGEAFGSSLTFGSVGAASAPGQMNAEDLRRILDLIHSNSESK